MFENLESVERRFEEIDHMLMQSGIDGKELTKLSRERASIEDLVTGYRQFRDLSKRREDAKAMLLENDEEMRTLAKEELGEIEVEIAACEKNLILLMLPSDPNDAKNVILEVRAGTGGKRLRYSQPICCECTLAIVIELVGEQNSSAQQVLKRVDFAKPS